MKFSGIIQYLCFCAWLISLSIMSSRFICDVDGRISLLCKAEQYCIVYICPTFSLFHSSVNIHLDCFYDMANVNKVCVNMGVQIDTSSTY